MRELETETVEEVLWDADAHVYGDATKKNKKKWYSLGTRILKYNDDASGYGGGSRMKVGRWSTGATATSGAVDSIGSCLGR